MIHPTDLRRQRIRSLVAAGPVESQARLLELLEAEGISATQSVLSRDLRALGIGKSGGVYREDDRVTPLEALTSLLRGVASAGPHLVVVHAEPGAASAVARALEAEDLTGLVGTVAGDDAIFVAVDSPEAGERVRQRILEILP